MSSLAAAVPAAIKNKLYTLVLLAERAHSGAVAPALSPVPVAGKVTLSAVTPYARLLMGMKKRGFGAGKWNGFGGKIEIGETPRAAAIREMREESGIELDDSSLSKRAVLLQEFERDGSTPSASSQPMMEIHVYLAEQYSGSLVESEEMRPAWCDVRDLPYASMWADDEHWYPVLLSEEAPRFKAHFLFRGESKLLSHTIQLMTTEERESMEREDRVTRSS